MDADDDGRDCRNRGEGERGRVSSEQAEEGEEVNEPRSMVVAG